MAYISIENAVVGQFTGKLWRAEFPVGRLFVIQNDDRPTWIEYRPQSPDGGEPTFKPIFVVHLLDEAHTMTLCKLPVPEGRVGQAGFGDVNPHNRCAQCEIEAS